MFDEQYIDSSDNIKLCTLFYNEHTALLVVVCEIF